MDSTTITAAKTTIMEAGTTTVTEATTTSQPIISQCFLVPGMKTKATASRLPCGMMMANRSMVKIT